MSQLRTLLKVPTGPPTSEKSRIRAGITSSTTTTVGASSLRAHSACFSFIPGNTCVLCASCTPGWRVLVAICRPIGP